MRLTEESRFTEEKGGYQQRKVANLEGADQLEVIQLEDDDTGYDPRAVGLSRKMREPATMQSVRMPIRGWQPGLVLRSRLKPQASAPRNLAVMIPTVKWLTRIAGNRH